MLGSKALPIIQKKDCSSDMSKNQKPSWEKRSRNPSLSLMPKISRRTLLIGGIGSLAAGSLLATGIGLNAFQHTLQIPQKNPHLLFTLPFPGKEVVWDWLWSPDLKYLAIGEPGGVHLLDGSSGQQRWFYHPIVPESSEPLFTQTWSSDGQQIYSVLERTIYALDTASGELLWTGKLLPDPTDDVPPFDVLAWSRDGRLCAIASSAYPGLAIWDIPACKQVAFCALPEADAARSPAESPVGNQFVLEWSPDGQQLASIDKGGNIHVWSPVSGPPKWSWSYATQVAEASSSSTTIRPWISWSPNGDILASGNFLGEFALWQAESGQLLFQKQPSKELNREGDIFPGACWSPDGTRLAVFVPQGLNNLLLQVWSIPSRRLLSTCQGDGRVFQEIAWSPNGNYLAANFSAEATNTDDGILVWDTSNGQALYQSPIFGANLTWVPDSRFLLFSHGVALDKQCQPSLHGTACITQHFLYQVLRLG
jgi:WD40 repeat protein